MKKYLIFLFIFSLSWMGITQTTNSTKAPGWSLEKQLVKAPHYTILGVDKQELLAEDAINESQKIGPYRFGQNFDVQVNILSDGTETILENGDRLINYQISAADAVSLNLIFDEFYLPEGVELYFYASDRSHLIGAYTSNNNNQANVLGTELIESDNGIIELFIPSGINISDIQLRLSTITYGYKKLNGVAQKLLRDLNDSGDCNVDVNCPLGNGWEDQIRSVGMIIANGNGACTGALINNTLNDGTPYFLTADHCGNNPTSWVFRFRWESTAPSCATTSPSGNGPTNYESVNGAITRASNAGSDFHLIELNTAPSPAWDIYYAGWDNSDNAVPEAIGIHHPSGDIKKICKENNALSQMPWNGAACWEIADWDEGVTEPGSSGSPLFDQNGRIIGQLYGGSAACNGTSDNDEPDYYGRLGVSWNGASASVRLSDWLDPNNSGVSVLDGFNPLVITNDDDILAASMVGVDANICGDDELNVEFKFRNNGFNQLNSVDIYVDLNGNAQLIQSWTGSLASGDYEDVTLPAISISDGDNQVLKIYTDNPNGVADEDPANDTVSITFNAKTVGSFITIDYYTDCNGSEVSMELEGTVTNQTEWTLNQGDWTNVDFFGEEGNVNVCMADSCGLLTINDSGGDGWGADGTTNCFAGSFGVYLDILNEDGIVIASMNDIDFGNQTNIGFCKSSLVKLADNNIQKIKMYPNPNSGILTIETSEEIIIELYDIKGALLLKREINVFQSQIDISDLSKGMYLIQWKGNNTNGQEKLIKK